MYHTATEFMIPYKRDKKGCEWMDEENINKLWMPFLLFLVRLIWNFYFSNNRKDEYSILRTGSSSKGAYYEKDVTTFPSVGYIGLNMLGKGFAHIKSGSMALWKVH